MGFGESAFDFEIRSLPFPVLQAKSHVNQRAKDAPRFSVRIREDLPRMSLDRGGAR